MSDPIIIKANDQQTRAEVEYVLQIIRDYIDMMASEARAGRPGSMDIVITSHGTGRLGEEVTASATFRLATK
jgi:molybdopterin biosynthesis enzyme MoaB